MTVTMRDVALYAAVSVATVSRVLNNAENVTEDTRQHVLDAIAKLGYRVNTTARNLRTQKTRTIAVIFSSMIYAPFLPPVEAELLKHGYTLTVGTTHDSPEKAITYIDLLTQQRVDGICWFFPRLNPRYFLPILNSHTPCLFINYHLHGIPYLDFDFRAAAYLLTIHLIEQGHEHIGFLNLPMENFLPAQWRLEGYQQAFWEAGLDINGAYIFLGAEASPERTDWYHAAHRLFDLPQPPTAIIAYNDHAAQQVYKVCAERNLRIPQDVSVVGLGDFPVAEMLYPELTTIRLPMMEMSQHVVHVLLKMIDGKHWQPLPDTLFPPELIIRGSTVQR